MRSSKRRQTRKPRITNHESRFTPLRIEPRLKRIMAQEYPRFSEAEYARRHNKLAVLME